MTPSDVLMYRKAVNQSINHNAQHACTMQTCRRWNSPVDARRTYRKATYRKFVNTFFKRVTIPFDLTKLTCKFKRENRQSLPP